MNWIEEIKRLSDAEFDNIVQIRRHIHMHPELSFFEEKTAKFISEKLTELGILHKNGVAGHGIHGVLCGKKVSKACIFLRADMDALPIQEENEVEYSSKNPGVMHACGHDVHSASLLGALTILKKLEDHWGGKISFVFQPAEEKLPGGASLMIKEGVLNHPAPSSAFAQHVYTPLEAGVVGFREGMYMASTDEIYVDFIGKGGHAAVPQFNIDPIQAGSEFLLEVYKRFEANKPQDLPSILAFGKITASGATNVIPDKYCMEGTMRTLNENWRKVLKELIKETAQEIAEKHKAKAEVRIENGYPVLNNDIEVTQRAKEAAKLYLGKDKVVDLDLRMTAEDFAYFSQQLPACFYRLGTGNPALGITANVHNAHFNIDEEALKTGMGLMAWLALHELNSLS